MPASLPSFSSGLKLIRLAVFVTLAQLAVAFVMTVKALGADSFDDIRGAIEWTQYLLLANVVATLGMLLGVLRAIPELARARMDIGGLVIAASGFAITAAALGWNYHLISSFVDVAFDRDSSLSDVMAAAESLESAKYIVIVKDLAYSIALITVLRTVQRSAAVNDQLGLRDEAGSMSRALIVMLVADLFYQLTYGHGSVGILGLIGSLLVGCYWIYCHLRLARFLYNAAYFVNEPHDLPIATVIRGDARAPRGSAPAARASRPAVRPAQPAAPPPQAAAPPPQAAAPPTAVVPPTPPAPTPRADSSAESGADVDGPRFLR